MLRETVIRYEDGTPRTHHATTNIVVAIDAETRTATARSYVTVFQALPGLLPMQPITAGRHSDRFEHRDGVWRFVSRRVTIHLVGDVRLPPARHLAGLGQVQVPVLRLEVVDVQAPTAAYLRGHRPVRERLEARVGPVPGAHPAAELQVVLGDLGTVPGAPRRSRARHRAVRPCSP
ncbi:nuclear transport factor 2 family protein [Streptomyces sp. NPDC054804]